MMKKITFALLGVLLASWVLPGCSSILDFKPKEGEPLPDTGKPVLISDSAGELMRNGEYALYGSMGVKSCGILGNDTYKLESCEIQVMQPQ